MKLIVNDSKVIETYMDSQLPSLAAYPAGTRVAWVPDDTALTTEAGYVIPDPRLIMSHDELVNCIRQDIDRKTQELIVYGYTYRGVRFPCTLDQQMNFKATFDMRTLLTYPFKVKGESQNFLMLADATEVFNWFMLGFQHVHTQLQIGWQMKDDVAALTEQQLLDYVDPRA